MARSEPHSRHGVDRQSHFLSLEPGDLQALGVFRSQQADVRMWVERLKNFYAALPKGDQASRASLEGVLLRLEQFAEGQMAWQYGAGPESMPVEDLGLIGPEEDPWGLTDRGRRRGDGRVSQSGPAGAAFQRAVLRQRGSPARKPGRGATSRRCRSSSRRPTRS